MRYKYYFIFFFSAINYISFAQSGLQSQQDDPVWENKIYKQGINTVLIYKEGWELSMPVIKLNSDEKIMLEFDETGNQKNRYYYTLMHCTPDWKESRIEAIDYLAGQDVGIINDAEFSRNTLVNFTNYRLEIPNEEINILISGNYILKIYEDNDPDKPILTRRFYVYEPLIEITANIEQLKVPRADGLNQRVNFELAYQENQIENPVETFSYKIIKNNESEKTFLQLKPSAIIGNQIKFEYLNALAFAGGNEFRHFDLKSLKFLSDRLAKIRKNNDSNLITLKPDLDRNLEKYSIEKDLNGRRLIKLEGENKSHILADYCFVHFELDVPLNLFQGNYYIFGSLTDYQTSDEFKMEYNKQSGKYEKTLFLKQGYYNYIYIFDSPDQFNNQETERYKVEGNHFQTENEYHLFIYYKPYGENYHKLVGFISKNMY